MKKLFVIKENCPVTNSTKGIKQILDAEYNRISLKTKVMNLIYLNDKIEITLLTMHKKNEKMFDGTLAKFTGSNYTIELKEDAKPYHTKLFLIPKTYEPTLKKEVNRLIEIGALKKIYNSQWAASTVIIPNINDKVRFITDSRGLNNTIKIKLFPIPRIQHLDISLIGRF